MSSPPPVFLLGPTASGKSGASLFLARALGAEILSMDAMAVYRGMDVATAKPDAGARRLVPHHGIDLVDASEEFHLGAFLALARGLLSGGKRILGLVGTPFYLHRLREGLFEGPSADWALRAKLEGKDPVTLRAELEALDPEAASAIRPTDVRRTVRALEVCLSTGKPISQLRRSATTGGNPAGFLLGIRRDSEDLKTRIRIRTERMFADGLVEEARRLALSRSASQAIGTKEVLGHLRGEYGMDEARARVEARTRQFAKRQMTWFRRFPGVRWVDAAPGEDGEPLAMRLLEALG